MKLLRALTIVLSLGIVRLDIITELLERITATEDIRNVAILRTGQDNFEYFPKSFFKLIPYVIYMKDEARRRSKEVQTVPKQHLFLIVCCDIEEDTLREAGTLFKTFRAVKGLFIDNSNATSSSTFFRWCWKNGFLDMLLWDRSSQNIQRYEQFPNFRVFKIGSVAEDELFNAKHQLKNLNGYPIKTMAFNDPPRITKYFDSKINKTAFAGYSYNILIEFIKNMNGTYLEIEMETGNPKELLEGVATGELDISVHPYLAAANYSSSFPLKTIRWEVMVPVPGPLDPYMYFILPFEGKVWFAIVLTMFYISVIGSLMQFLVLGEFKWIYCFCEVLLRLLNMSPETHSYNQEFIAMFFKVQVLVFAFIINNLYLAYLTTYLATELAISEIDSLEELVQKNIKILASFYEVDVLLKTANIPNFENFVVGVPGDEFLIQRNKLKNTSYAYTLPADKILVLFLQQEKLNRPIFQVMKSCISIVQLGLFTPVWSPFLAPFNDFLMIIFDSGLISKWEKDGVETSKQSGELEMQRDDYTGPYKPLNLGDLQFAWMCLAAGSGFAVLLFSGLWLYRIFRGVLKLNKA